MLTTDLALDDPAFWHGDPHGELGRLRGEHPLAWHDRLEVWVVLGHAEVQQISRNPGQFCSGKGVLLSDRERHLSGTESIIYLDPPVHNAQRKVVSAPFHARQVSRIEGLIRDLAHAYVDRIVRGDVVDVVSELAAPLPLAVIAELLGVAEGDRAKFREWSDRLIAASDGESAEGLAAAAEVYAYFSGVAEARRSDPGDDLVSMLVSGEAGGRSLTNAEVLGFCMTLLVAGNETTRNLLSGGLLVLANDRDQQGLVFGSMSSLDTADVVEELLRWVTPVRSFCRTATADTELADQTIREGDIVLMLYPAANRDPAVFGTTADQLDVTRHPNPHVSFGFAEHYCLGASLARLEARVVLEELASHFDVIELAGEPVPADSTLMNSLSVLPLVFS